MRRALALCAFVAFSVCAVAAAPKAGTYTATATGRNGDVTVAVTIADGKITAVKILNQSETASISDTALQQIPAAIVAGQTVSVDAVSGATATSDAILKAVKDCIKQAGGDLASFTKKAAAKTAAASKKELAADIAVVGGGASGISAAVSAADNGAKVVLIEKTGVLGGASLFSWAGFGFDSKLAKASGNTVDKETFIQDWISNCHWRLDAAVLRRFVNETGATYDWLGDKGWKLIPLNFPGSPVLHMLPDYATRPALFKAMLDSSVNKNGGMVLTNTTAKSLITDKNGAVVGVVTEQADGTIYTVRAKAVIMATGGYAGNKEMVMKAFGFGGVNGGLPQNVGEGLQMAWKAGAAVPRNFGAQMLHQTLVKANLSKFSPFENKYPLILSYVPPVINVTAMGARFRGEDATLDAVASANTSAFQGTFHYVVISKKVIDTLMTKGLAGIGMDVSPGMPPEMKPQFELDTPWKNAYQVFDAMVAGGWGYKGATLEELAKNAGMNPQTFVSTYNNYEKMCAAGADSEFGKKGKYMFSEGTEGPFYIIIAEINNLGSVGGLVINTKFQVLNDKRLPVPGLYGVGAESLGVLFNDTYVGFGAGVAWTFTSGRLGGAEAAKAVLVK
jgi:fumarate reductase flavoprotein subunit